ncbi:Na(+)-translocating NADH-quinone reductase subunit A [Croceibacter atlanticus]|jgi:Na+-transporting NADH:ubiquinone oxidoreductase subunit A|uniref:Na(+)-translocating NADH-quinone reductase subunit A n=1 Tax=Croceibacter atlanticus (strain ATCC BAA-628 / JCM 21780 / CIP 108009 / IAM 15332 / KCTC 12090 / HTCC2559) TaxID=216432 RepID=A3UAF5_CROAH|nr:Na(+)-translocating NADH-quinone reductase subunit A [Croceibacter atlanticus]EAP86791.1 Na(+)-translocating NADH-quinone reductase subunit A [Croceibacter atlanticus HTCC2559]
MSKDITIKKGLDIRLVGSADKVLVDAPKSKTCTIQPADFHLTIPKMVVKEGAKLRAGDELFYSKTQDSIKVVSPIAGTLKEITRGAKRVITHIVIEADGSNESRDFGAVNVASADAEVLRARFLESGLWPFIKQRPYDVIANPTSEPKAIFISGYASAPLVADLDYTLAKQEEKLQAAVTALSKMTKGQVHVTIGKDSVSPFENLKDITLHKITGPHPAGNVGTQISKIDPVNKGEVVWTVNAQDLIVIGESLLTGHFNSERQIAVAGSSVKAPKYFRTHIGADLEGILNEAGIEANSRVITGSVLTGDKTTAKGNLGYYHNTVTVIPEGDDYEFFGWNKPVFNKISLTRALTFSWMQPNKKYDLDTNTNGEHRAFVVTGMYEEVFPLDIYPLQIMKSCLVEDLDAMEQLGMYEVAPEDFALTEFVCVSKQPHQAIIRKGLDVMYKEIG